MVGVPTSNGCNTCLKRRIKCDEAKPKCQRCQKSGYTCAGYKRAVQFRMAVFSAHQATTKEPNNIRQTATKNKESCTAPRAERCQTPIVPLSLSLASFTPDICNAFLLQNFVWRSYGHNWLDLALSGKISPLALQAGSALSQSNFGSFHRQQSIKINGSIQYGKAVRSLIQELSNPTPLQTGTADAVEAALIVPIMILLIHESLLADPTGSVAHVDGLVRLMKVCGPERFQQEPLRSAFETCRATLITIGLISRKRCFLDEENWRSVPWAMDPSSKSPQNHLADIMATIPGMLEDDAALSRRRRQQDDSRATLLDRVERQLLALFTWRWEWETLNKFSAWEEEPSDSPPSSAIPPSRGGGDGGGRGQEDRIFNRTFHFTTFEQSTEILLYNAVQMWLIGLVWRLAPPFQAPVIISSAAAQSSTTTSGGGGGLLKKDHPPNNTTTTTSPLLLPGTSFSIRDPAIEICRVFEYQSRNISSGSTRARALFCLLPIGLAYGALEREARYREWIRCMLDSSPVMKEYVLGGSGSVRGYGLYYQSWRLPTRGS